jgi:hypothetical protein
MKEDVSNPAVAPRMIDSQPKKETLHEEIVLKVEKPTGLKEEYAKMCHDFGSSLRMLLIRQENGHWVMRLGKSLYLD